MNKKYNPTLLNTVVSGPGMKYPRKPLVLLGNDGEFAQGDLMDANAVLEAIDDAISGESEISEKINKEIRDREAAISNLETSFTSTLQGYINGGSYNSSTQKIELKNGSTVIASIDADQFITDGMVDDVRIENGNLIIDFNTASGKQDILIPLTDIFNPSNYYNKTEINAALSGKQNTIDDLANIRSGAQAGLTAYLKPQIGIPATDLEAAVQTSLGKADTALQSYTETDPTVPAWAKAANKPTYNYSEIGNAPTLATVATSGSYNDLSNKPTILTVASASDVEEGTSTEKALTPSNMEKIKSEVEDSLLPKDPATGHDYVEIAGIKWATMNVGAESETDTGLYFQWGDTPGYTADQVGSGEGKKAFTWADYKWTEDGGSTFTKYNGTDGKTVLDLEDDAARANWGGSWRMPTVTELKALGNAVNAVWTTNYNGSGVNGLLCTDKTDSSKTLFFPAAGAARNGSVNGVGDGGSVWSSSLGDGDAIAAEYIDFYEEDTYWGDIGIDRLFGLQVRGVLDDSITPPPSKLHKVAVTGDYNDLKNKPDFVNNGSYNSTTKEIELKHDNTVLATINATAFIKDGMVDSVVVENGNLVITFNTELGEDTVSIPLSQIFDPSNYYNKSEVDTALGNKQDSISDLANIRSGAQAGSTAVQPSTLNSVVNNLYNDGITDITSSFVVAETGKKIYEGAIVSLSSSLYTYPVHFEKGQTIKVTLTEAYSAYRGVAILSYESEDNVYTSLVNLLDSPSGFSFEYTFFEDRDVVFSITRPTLTAKIELYQNAVLKPDVDEVKPYKYFYTKWLKYSINAIPNVGETFNPENIRYHDSVSTYRRTYAECKEGDVFYFGKTYGKTWIITDENFVVLKKMVIDVLEEYIEIPKDGKYLFCQVNKVPTEQYPHILYKKCTQEEYKDIYVSTSQVPIEATVIENFYPPRPKMGWNMSGNVGDIFDYSYINTTGCSYSIDVKAGDIFYLTNHIYSDVNYLVLDSCNRIIKKVISSFNRWWLIDYKIEIPEGGTKLLWNGDSDCILESETGFGAVSLKDDSVLPNIVKRVINNSGEGTTRRFCLSWASDTHNDVIRYKRFIDFTNKHQGCFDVVLHTGDGNRMSDQDKGFEKTVNTYKPDGHLMFAIGNHDAHGQTRTSGIKVLSSGSRLWNGENYCAKFFDESTVYSADKCNFYRDFASSKIRIIVLNDYDCPRYASSTNWVTTTDETEIASAVDWVAGTTYQVGNIINYKGLYLKCLVQGQLEEGGTVWSDKQTYARSRFNVDCVYWSQEKINFFVNALNVEQGWSIIVASHCPMELLPSDSSKVIEKWTYRKNNAIPSINVKYGQNGYVLQDILTAYLNRTTINQTYKAITPNSVPSSGSLINLETYLPDVTVDADFTSAVGDVVCYLHGHQHCDSAFYSDHMGNLKFLTIGNINNTYKPMDMHEPWFSGDIIKGEDSKDSFNLLSIDTTEKKVYIVRVGADMTDDLSVRDYMGISYAHT